MATPPVGYLFHVRVDVLNSRGKSLAAVREDDVLFTAPPPGRGGELEAIPCEFTTIVPRKYLSGNGA
jgi:hypothetical protein